MSDSIERTEEAQRGFNGMTTKVTSAQTASRFSGPPKNGAAMDPFDDNTPVAQTCNTENPEACEACD